MLRVTSLLVALVISALPLTAQQQRSAKEMQKLQPADRLM